MGEKVILDLFQDPRYIPDNVRPLKRELPNMQTMVVKPFPDNNPGEWIQKGTSFFSTGEYTIDEKDNIYFKDPNTGENIYLNKVDSTNSTHKIYAQHILKDLSQFTNTVRLPTGRDTTVYARGIGLYHNADESVAATRTKSGKIVFNMNYQGGGIISNVYSILSIQRHEHEHLTDDHQLTDIEHAENIYKMQMTYDEFKKAPIKFQISIIKSYAVLVKDGCKAMGIKQIGEIQRRYFDNFNKGIGKELGASITYDEKEDWYFTIKINGEVDYVNLTDEKKTKSNKIKDENRSK